MIGLDDSLDLTELEKILERLPHNPSQLIIALQAIQAYYHYLPEPALQKVSQVLGVDFATVMTVATFYNIFRLKKAGKHHIHVCVGTACHVAGAQIVYQAFRRYLKIPDSEDTDIEKQFTVSEVACLGCCMMAPVVQIDSQIYGWVKPDQIANVTSDFLARQEQVPIEMPKNISFSVPLAKIQLCRCSSCIAAGSDAVYREITKQIAHLQIPAYVVEVSCLGISYQSPLVEIILPDNTKHCYGRVADHQVPAMLLAHLQPVSWKRRVRTWISMTLEKFMSDSLWPDIQPQKLNFVTPDSILVAQNTPTLSLQQPLVTTQTSAQNTSVSALQQPLVTTQTSASNTPLSPLQQPPVNHTPESCYVGLQKWIALEHAGKLAPLDIAQYRSVGGFSELENIIRYGSPERVISQIQASGLRGRGGAGFPTSQKWIAVQQAQSNIKYIIANGDEGDPGAFMDRLILECFPFRVLEGMIIAGFCIGATQGYLYIRAEYPLAVTHIQQALDICRQYGYLGKNILGTSFNLDLEVVPGAGAFVCGEETGLIQALEGKPGRPRYRPPYPAHQGLWGKPTLINNVETYSLVPWILRNGASAFSQIGTATSKGTKSFALAGKIRRGGLIEVPMGISLRQIVEEIGGGAQNGHWKAVQIGGPSGGCIPEQYSDVPVDYQELIRLGAMMGSGGLVVLDEHDCMVDIARYFLSFTQQESCGKCSTCRIGTKQMLDILNRICNRQGKEKDLEELERLAKLVQSTSLCGLGKSAPNPVLSTLRYYREEYLAHLQGRCPAKHCQAFIEYRVTSKCIGCTKCSQQCSVSAIQPLPYQRQQIDSQKCTRCDGCRQICPTGAIEIANICDAIS